MNSLIDSALKCRTLSIIGMAKNTGKTVCLNYLLKELDRRGKAVAVTSVGIDGEKTDQITQTEKPEIELSAGTVFETSEYHYRQKQLVSNVLDVSSTATTLGRLVTAEVLVSGKVILSGPSSSAGVRNFIERMDRRDVDITIIDGALSRKSHASPAITQGLVLAVGTAVAPDLNTIVKKTTELRGLMMLPEYQCNYSHRLFDEETGIFALEDNDYRSLDIPSALLTDKYKEQIFRHGHTLFVSGVLTDSMLNFLKMQPEIKKTVVVVKDFTKIFVTPMTLKLYLSKGGQIFVLKQPNLIAVTVNPVAPSGFKMPSEVLRTAMEGVFNVPVYDVMNN